MSLAEITPDDSGQVMKQGASIQQPEIMPNTVMPENQEPEQLSFIDQEPEPYEYELLKGHYRTDGIWKSDEQLKTEYVRLTDNIVHVLTDGVRCRNKQTGEIEKRPVDYVVWLDKSARPVSWLTKALWPVLARNSDGHTPKLPQFRFVNIDREQWTSSIDPNNVGSTNVDKLDPSIIRSLRSVFIENPNKLNDKLDEQVDELPAQFDDKTILIVDEVKSTGRTLSYAQSFFERAFPTANIAGMHWMAGITAKDGAFGNLDLPVWYSDDTVMGRGVRNRNVDLSLKSSNAAQRRGARFLSTAFRDHDPLSTRLREEMRHLATDVINHVVLVEPSRFRDEKDYDERAVRLNAADSLADYLAKLRELKVPSGKT